MPFKEVAQNGHGVERAARKVWRVPSLFGGVHPRPLRFLQNRREQACLVRFLAVQPLLCFEEDRNNFVSQFE
jgi:hypothetical protein